MADAMPSPEPLLQTARLILRVPSRDDFEAWAALGADEVAATSAACNRALRPGTA